MEGSLSAKKRMRLALFFGASDLNFSSTPSNVDTVASTIFSGIFAFSQGYFGKSRQYHCLITMASVGALFIGFKLKFAHPEVVKFLICPSSSSHQNLHDIGYHIYVKFVANGLFYGFKIHYILITV